REAVDADHRAVAHNELAHLNGRHDVGRYRPPMLDPRRLRTELDVLKKGLARRGVDTSVLDTAADLDERHRQAIATRDDIRSRVNALSKEVGEAFKQGDKATGERKREESKALGDEEKQAEQEARDLDLQL